MRIAAEIFFGVVLFCFGVWAGVCAMARHARRVMAEFREELKK
jgi:hypothetical protein